MGGSSSSFDYDQQLANDTSVRSVEVGEEQKEQTRVHRNIVCKDSLLGVKDDCVSIWDCFQKGVKINPENKMLGTRKFVMTDSKKLERKEYLWLSYGDADKEARQVGAGLVKLGCKAKENVGIFSSNQCEWIVSALGLYSQNMRVVSLYATLGEDAVTFIVNHAEIAMCFVSRENLKSLLKSLPNMPTLKTIILYDYDARWGDGEQGNTVSFDDKKLAAEHGCQLLAFSELKQMGIDNPVDLNPPTAKDLCYIMYTSGTTGNPKGAMLTHQGVAVVCTYIKNVYQLSPTDVHLSYLPLAHIFETVVLMGIVMHGGAVGFSQGDIKMLTPDIIELQPTLLVGVPRVFGRIYQKVFATVGGLNYLKRSLFNFAYKSQCDKVRLGAEPSETFNKKFFIPIREKMGLGRCKFIITGAAPCSPYLMEFLKVVVGAHVVQGYGMTETCGSITCTTIDDNNMGHTGGPYVCCEVKLRDVPEMNYFSTDSPPRGEVLVRGPNVFAGYYKDEEQTAEAFAGDWLCSGDIARWNPNGTLSIIDRRKNIFKMSQGEYIAAERVEGVYGQSEVVGQMWVYGNGFKSMVLAVVVPNAERLWKYAIEKGWLTDAEQGLALASEPFCAAFASLCEGEHAAEIKEFIVGKLNEQNHLLKGFEKVKDILIECHLDHMLSGFTDANGCLTPTFKLRRNNLLTRYMPQLKAMYTALGEPDSPDEKWPGE